MYQKFLERQFQLLKQQVEEYGDIELTRAYIFELNIVLEDLRRLDYLRRYCG